MIIAAACVVTEPIRTATSKQKQQKQQKPTLFAPGLNCCAVARAERVGLLIDGEAYFRAFSRAAERANDSIVIIAWDFNSAARLDFDEGPANAPLQVGDFLNWLVRRNHALEVYVLDWDYPMLYGAGRELPPLYGMGWEPHERVHLAYDNTHPIAGSHHQKIVVIDDRMAFLGGLDLTAKRWDTSEHAADDSRRMMMSNRLYPPFHDTMMAMDGEAAKVLGTIARFRWRAATGQTLKASPLASASEPSHADPWPPQLRIDITHVELAIARTFPASTEGGEVREVERLYLDMIAAARRHIYLENQYFTAFRIGEALAARLAEPDGPEVVMVLRQLCYGWLEEHTMQTLRTALLERLRHADAHGRLRVFYAHVDGLADGICINVHSKVMIVDDEVLRIGSANLNNRSMGLDSECDAAIEARGDPLISASIHDFRNRLVSEHLGTTPARVAREMERSGSLCQAIAAVQEHPDDPGSPRSSRTLKPLEPLPELSGAVIEIAQMADPERAVTLDRLIEIFTPEPAAPRLRSAAIKLGVAALILGGLTLLAATWRYTPLAAWLTADQVIALANEFADRPWAPLAIIAAYTPACLLMFPRPLITLCAVVAFGPRLGFSYALAGILLASFATFVIGRLLPSSTVSRLAGKQLNRVTNTLRRHGLLAVTALRLVPLAPFPVLGVVSGAIRIDLWRFMLGSLFGMLPGTIVAAVFAYEIETALRDPSQINYWPIAVMVIAVIALSIVVQRWLVADHAEPAPTAPLADDLNRQAQDDGHTVPRTR